jgi:large subunit ribosomal protein L16
MLYKPKSRKFPKAHKGRVSPLFHTSQSLIFGSYGIVALQPSRLTASQIAAAELAIKRKIKKDGKLFLRVFPHIPASHKPAEVRMGKGKGAIEY